MYTINVAPELTLFDELKRGDTLTVRLYESVIVAVRPDVKPSIAVDTTASANQRERENAEVVGVIPHITALYPSPIVYRVHFRIQEATCGATLCYFWRAS